MQYIFNAESGASTLLIKEDTYRYLFKVRRHKINKEFFFRNLKDTLLYKYSVQNISKKEALLILESSVQKRVEPIKKLHLAWCVIDTKLVEKYITSLNEIGVSKITFVFSQFSQKNFKPNLEKLNKILINSSQQCGRSSLMELDVCKSVEDFLNLHPKTKILDFSEHKISETSNIETILVGTEGGFSDEERSLFNSEAIVGLDSNLILRSETATLSVASKILL